MKSLHKLVIMLASAGFFVVSAQAQNAGTVTNHAVPIGKGPGVTGFGSAIPGTAGLPLTSNGASSDPSFQALGNSGLAHMPADTVKCNPTGSTANAQDCNYQLINVKDFGAKGDGTTDDTTAISNAITFANTFSGSVGSPASWRYACLIFPSGDYKISSSLTATNCIRGQGQARIVGTTTAFDLFSNANITRLDVTDLTFVNGRYAFNIGNNNIDNALFNFTRAHFYSTGGYAINASAGTPGPYSTVVNCRDCNWYNTNGAITTTADVLNIEGGWGEPFYSNWTVDQGFFVMSHAATYINQQIKIVNFSGIPVLFNSGTYYKGRWIDMQSAGTVNAFGNRWGGEFAGIPIIYYSGSYESASPYRGGAINIVNSPETYCGASANSWSGCINIHGGMPQIINWHGNAGGPLDAPIVVNEGAGSGGVTVSSYLSGWVTATGLTNNDIANYFVWNVDLASFRSSSAAPTPSGTNNITRYTTTPGAKFIGDANYTILPTDRVVILNTTLTAPRSWTLPAANSVAPNTAIRVLDLAGGASPTNYIAISRAGADTIEGAGVVVNLATAFDGITLISDGTSKWAYPIQGIEQGGTGAVTAAGARVALGAASLSSPSFTGTPTAPTATAGDNTTQIATDAFVQTAIVGTNTAWTPSLKFGGASTGLAYTAQSGNIFQIGRLQLATFVIQLSAVGSSTGAATITGLPNIAPDGGAAMIFYASGMASLPAWIGGYIGAGGSTINLTSMGSTGVTNLTNANFTNSTLIYGQVVMRTP